MSHGRHCVACGAWVYDGQPFPHDCPKTLTEVFEREWAELERKLSARLGLTVAVDPAMSSDRLSAAHVQDGKVVGVIKNIGAPRQEGASE